MADRDGSSLDTAPGPAAAPGGPETVWHRLERWLIEPPPSVRSPEDRNRARLLGMLAPSALVAGACVEIAFWAASKDYTWAWYMYALTAGGYVLGRCGHVRLGALLFVYTLPVVAFVRVSTGVAFNALVPLTALILPPIVAAILLTRSDVLVLLAVEISVPLALVAFFPSALPEEVVVTGPIALTAVAGVLVLAFMRQGDALERLRQQDLRTREEHFRALVANVPGVVYRLALEGDGRRVTYVSDGIRALAGRGPEEFLGERTLDDLIHVDDRERVQLERQRSLERGCSYALEYRVVGLDQNVRWVLDRGHEVRDAEDRAECIDGVLIDVTLRQTAVAEQGRLAAIVEATSDMVATAHADGRLRFMNRAGRKLLGWSDAEDVSRHRISDTHPPWALEIVEGQGLPTAIEQGLWAGETAVRGGEGREIPVSQVIMAHRSAAGDLEFLSTIMRDLSERASAAVERAESEERFRLLASAAFEGIAITAEGRVVDANEQLAAMLGMEREKLIGREVMDFVALESRERVLDHFRRRSEEPYEHLAQRADGTVFPVEIRARTIPLGGRPQRVTALRDLTERKRAEDERAALERHAQHRQKLESLGVLAGGIAHDFNNLLVAVLGNLDLATASLPSDAPQRRPLELAEHAAQQGAALAAELLAYSGRGRFVVRPIDLSSLVDEMGQLLRAAIHKTIRLETRLERPMSPIMGDASQLQQVIMNLIVNAAEAVGERPGTITLTTGVEECDAESLLRSRLPAKPPPGRFARVEVTDDGDGMTAETLERLFDPFFSTKLVGRGLGMAAVQGIVRGHGGAILVDSTPGRGTTFRIYLPVTEAHAVTGEVAEDAPEAELPSAPGPDVTGNEHGGLALVVDDEALVRDTSQAMLKHLGFSVMTAADGREALDLLGRVGEHVAVVLLDLTMPGMDGLETLAELRRMRPGLKVVLTSGFDEAEISERCVAERPDGFLQKPYRLEAFEDAVRATLRR